MKVFEVKQLLNQQNPNDEVAIRCSQCAEELGNGELKDGLSRDLTVKVLKIDDLTTVVITEKEAGDKISSDVTDMKDRSR
jgi:hypothetical protein